MLGKLIKHEWKNTYKAGCLILASLVAITFLGWLAFQSPMWRSISGDGYRNYDLPLAMLDLVSIFTLLFYAIMLAAASAGIIIYLALQFYRTMYSGEGYLTHTLPVTKNQLLISKILIGGVWTLIVTLGIMVSLGALVSFLVAASLPDEYTMGEFWRMFFQEFSKMIRVLERELDFELSFRLIIGIVSMVIGPFITLTILFGAISLGQLFTKHRVLMAIVCYIGVQMVSGLLGSLIEVIAAAVYATEYGGRTFGVYMDVNSFSSHAVELILAIVLYLASYLVATKKLNLE